MLGFFKNHLFLKNLSGIPSECRTIWIQIRPDVLSSLISDLGLNYLQSYPQMTVVGKELTLCKLVDRVHTGKYEKNSRAFQELLKANPKVFKDLKVNEKC